MYSVVEGTMELDHVCIGSVCRKLSYSYFQDGELTVFLKEGVKI